MQILNDSSLPRPDRSKSKAANATIGPPPQQPNTTTKERNLASESSVVAAAAAKKNTGGKRTKRKRKKKFQKKKKKHQPQKDEIAIDTLLNQDGQSNNLYHGGDGKGEEWAEESWLAKDNGWGVRRTSQSAAVVVKNRLTTKTQEARPATLAGIAPMKPTNPPLPVGSGLSGRRKGFMSWIHDAAKAQKKKVLGMKLTTKQTTISGHTIMRSEKTKRSKKDRTNNNVMVVPWGIRSNHTESSQKLPLHLRKIGRSRRSERENQKVGGAGCSKLPRLPLLYR